MRLIPSLNGLRAFEAAARHGGFAGGARELNVSPAAISRMVRLLEERLGVTLFERRANGLMLTETGREYQAGLTPVFDEIASLTRHVTRARDAQVLTVGVGPTFAIRWLIPRLAGFAERAPGIDLRIATGGTRVPFAEDWSCGIRLGEGNWPGFIAESLVEADLLPVCAPSLGEGLTRPADLVQRPLLRVAHAPSDWTLWFEGTGHRPVVPEGPVFEYYGHALQAALDGVGVAMGIRPYIDDDLAAGRLIAPFRPAVSKRMGWYLVYRAERSGDESFQLFRDWITEAAASPHALLEDG